MKAKSNFLNNHGNNILRFGIATGLILLVPLVAMLFTEEVQWTGSDFVVAGALLFGAGLAYELIATRARTTARQTAIAVVILATLLLVWAELAVGIFD